MDNYDKNMTTGNVVISWGIAALAGFIAFLLFVIMGEWNYSAAGFGGVFIALVLIVIFTIIFGRNPTPLNAPKTELRPRPVGPDAPIPTATVTTRAPGSAPTVAASSERNSSGTGTGVASSDTSETAPKPASAPIAPKAAPAATAAVVAGSGGSGGGAAAATSPAATGTPVGEGAATAGERTEAEHASRAAIATAKPVAPSIEDPGVKPATLPAPRGGTADDLKRIKGVGPKMERMCNDLGFWHFDQIASWNEQEVAWVDQNLEGFKGRVSRDEWVAQAKALAAGGDTDFSQKVDKGDVY